MQGTVASRDERRRAVQRAFDGLERETRYCPSGGFFGYRSTRQFLDGIVDHVQPGDRCLDLGCGPTMRWRPILEAYGVDWYGADVVVPDRADERFRRVVDNRIEFPDGHFDVVSTIDVFEHVTHLDAMVAEIARTLKPGGVLWGATAFWQTEHDSYFHMTHRGLRLLLERNGFEVVELVPSRMSGLMLVSQRLLGGDGRLHTKSFGALFRSGVRCALNVVPYTVANLFEFVRFKIRNSNPLDDCCSLMFVARRVSRN